MQYTKEICRRYFESSVSKQAYLDACKWLAKNIYSSPSYSENVVVKIQKQEPRKVQTVEKVKLKNGKIKEKEVEVDYFSFRVIVYYQMNLTSAKEQFCNNCKQIHESFFCEKQSCSDCKLKVLMKKLDFEIDGITQSLKKSLEGAENEKNS